VVLAVCEYTPQADAFTTAETNMGGLVKMQWALPAFVCPSINFDGSSIGGR